MDESEVTYSTRQVADSLGLGAAMVRKYALAYEAMTGQEIPMKRRDGRQFSREHFDVISKAKALVDSNNGLSVDTALKMVLSGPENAADTLAASKTSNNTQELMDTLTAAIAKGNEPLLAELRELRQELRRGELGALPKKDSSKNYGLLVNLAYRVENFFKKIRS